MRESSSFVVFLTSTVPMHLPFRSTVHLSATAMISFSLCEMNRMLLPSAARLRMISISSSISCGVKTAVGSSKISISLFRYSILSISVRCCIPTVISEMSASGSIRSPYFSLSSTTRLRASVFLRKPAEFVGSTPRMMLSSTLKISTSLKCWCTMPIPSAFASFGSLISTVFPFLRISPSSGWYSPKSTLIRVLLPAPFSPKRAWISPFLSCNVILSFATIPGNRFVMPIISTAYSQAFVPSACIFFSAGSPAPLCSVNPLYPLRLFEPSVLKVL